MIKKCTNKLSRFIATAALSLAGLAIIGCGVQKEVSMAPNPSKEDHSRHEHASTGRGHDHSGWWCDEHGVPEADCSMCDPKVASALKAKGDWCNDHDRAKSQCFICDPKLADKFAALYRAKEGKNPPDAEAADGRSTQ